MRHANLLRSESAVLLVVDVQEGFRQHIVDFEKMAKNIATMAAAAEILKIPVLVTEQYPKGLGHTVTEIAGALHESKQFEKSCFSCCQSREFMDALSSLDRKQVLVTGIEAHVCVNQTVHDLLANDFAPHIISDAVSSRSEANKAVGIEKMLRSGAVISSVEMSLFEMLYESGTAEFKAVQRLVK